MFDPLKESDPVFLFLGGTKLIPVKSECLFRIVFQGCIQVPLSRNVTAYGVKGKVNYFLDTPLICWW